MTCACSPLSSFGTGGESRRFRSSTPLEAFQHASLANVLNGLGAARQGVGDLPVGPRRPVRLGPQEDLSTAHLLAAALELPDCLSTDLAFLVGESDDILFCTGTLSVPRALMFSRGAALVAELQPARLTGSRWPPRPGARSWRDPARWDVGRSFELAGERW